MARTLPAGMAANITAASQAPAFSCTLQDLVQRPTLMGSNASARGRTCSVVTNGNAIVEASVRQGADPNVLEVRRISDPTSSTQWQQNLSTLTSGALASAGCAISKDGSGNLNVYYQSSADRKIYYYSSTNDGVSWSGPTATNGALPLGTGNFCYGLACDGNLNLWGIFASYDPNGACILARSTYSGSWSAWSNEGPSSPTWGLMRGISCATNGAATDFACGVQTRSGLNGIAAGTFYRSGGAYGAISTPVPFDTPNLGLSYANPCLFLYSGVWWMAVTLTDSGSVSGVAQARTQVLSSTDFVSWTPFASLGYVFQYGCQVVRHSNGSVYVFDAVNCYSFPAGPAATDVSNDVLSVTITDHLDDPASVTVVLDNTSGAYLTDANARADATLSVAFGYAGQTVTTHVAIVDTLTFEVSPRQNTVTINARSHPKLLDYPSARFVAYSNQSLAAIITDICQRSGATLAALPGTSQFSQTLSCFMIPPGETWLSALKRLSGIYGFSFFGTAAPSIKVVEPQPGDASVWSYGSEILAASYGLASDQANVIRVSGSSSPGAVTPFAEAIDTTNLTTIGRERYRNVVDRNLDTAAKCQIRATFTLQEEQRHAVHGQLVCALNPQHELLDVISITDAAIGASNLALRIESISWVADFETGVYEQQLHLSGV